MLILVAVAGFLTVGLAPAVDFLVRRRLRRTLVVLLVLGELIGLFGGFVASAVPSISKQATVLAPRYVKCL